MSVILCHTRTYARAHTLKQCHPCRHPCRFVEGGQVFTSAEQYMMVKKVCNHLIVSALPDV